LVKTENGSRGVQPYREVQIAQRCLAPLPLRDSNDNPYYNKLYLINQIFKKRHILPENCVARHQNLYRDKMPLPRDCFETGFHQLSSHECL